MNFFWTPVLIISSVIIIFGCDSKPKPRTNPKDAFARLSVCLNQSDTDCLFRELDRDSRWSIHSIYKTLKQIDALVKQSYPQQSDSINSAYGGWQKEAACSSPEEMFAVFCQKQHCLTTVSKGFGAILKMDLQNNSATLTTTRNHTFKMKSFDGKWGLATWNSQLQKIKINFIDNLEQVKRSAADFEQQKAAIGKP